MPEPGGALVDGGRNGGGVAQFEIGVPEVTVRSLTPLGAVLRAPVVVTAGGATLADLAFHGEGNDGFYLVGRRRLPRVVGHRGAGRGGEGLRLPLISQPRHPRAAHRPAPLHP